MENEEQYQFQEGELTFLLYDFKKMEIAPEGFYPTFKEGYRLAMTRKTANEKAFLEWLDKEIDGSRQNHISKNMQSVRLQWQARINILEEVKEKFLTLTPPPSKQ